MTDYNYSSFLYYFLFQIGEIQFWWVWRENTWVSPIFHHLLLSNQIFIKSLFSHLFSIFSILLQPNWPIRYPLIFPKNELLYNMTESTNGFDIDIVSCEQIWHKHCLMWSCHNLTRKIILKKFKKILELLFNLLWVANKYDKVTIACSKWF